jgi:hypothetical protein
VSTDVTSEASGAGSAARRRKGHTGGVSTEPSDLAARKRRTRAGTVDPGFAYGGGPIIANPQVHATFWGQAWGNPDHATRRGDLIQFLQDFIASDYMNILSQYGVGQGAGKCGTWLGASDVPTVSGELTDTGIHQQIQSMIDAGTVPEPGSPSEMALMIYLDESIEVNDPTLGVVMCEPQGDSAFGYHNFFSTTAGNKFYYSVIPALDDKCLKESCPQDNSCSLHLALTQEQRQTQVSSHEFTEMTTDPEINAWRDPNSGEENGDLCNGQTGTITVSGRSWTVQLMYSKTDDTGSGAACVIGPPNPLPSLLPGG